MASTQFIRLVNGIPTMQTAVPNVVNQQTTVGSTITAGTNVTLPSAMSYTSDELEIKLGGQKLEVTIDYNYVGSGTRTQVVYTFDLVAGDQLSYRTDRIP